MLIGPFVRSFGTAQDTSPSPTLGPSDRAATRTSTGFQTKLTIPPPFFLSI